MNDQVKTSKFRKTFLFGQSSQKNSKVLKAELGVSENAGHHHTHIYLQHRSNKSTIICMWHVYMKLDFAEFMTVWAIILDLKVMFTSV